MSADRILLAALTLFWAVIFAPIVYIGGPEIGSQFEEAIRPVLTDSVIDDVRRDDDYACWRWSFVKPARKLGGLHIVSALLEADLKLSLPDRDILDAAPLIKVPRGVMRYVRMSRTSPGDGQRHHRIWCIDMERSEIGPETPIEVTQAMRYRSTIMLRWPRWWRDATGWGDIPITLPWRTWAPAPRFEIPAAR